MSTSRSRRTPNGAPTLAEQLEELRRLVTRQRNEFDERLAAQRAELEGEITRLRAERTERVAPPSPATQSHGWRAAGPTADGPTAHDAARGRGDRRATSRRGLLKLGGATAAGFAAAVAAPQLVGARPAMPADAPGIFTADTVLTHPYAVHGTGTNGADGVYGQSDSGYGVFGVSATSLDIYAGGTGRIRQENTISHPGPPTASDGSFLPGEQIRDSNYALWICTAFGIPGTWRQVAAVAPGYAGGALNLLPVPIRLLDTRADTPTGGANDQPGAPVAYHGTIDVPAAGVTFANQTIPAAATAVFGLLTAALAPGVNPGDGSSAIAYATGRPRPLAVNVVYNPQDGHGAYTSDFTLVATGASGKFSIYSQPIIPGVAVDYLFDCFGFVM